MRPMRFLVVDDSIAVVKRLGLILEKLGHTVVGMACNGIEAVQKCHKLKPDAITMDIQMPEMDGLEATRKILENHPDTPVIITAQGQESAVVDAIAAGAKHFIAKPVELKKVFGKG